MKNLHKKIGAIALAGMVVLGGFAASGVQSFASEKKAVVVKKQVSMSPEKELQSMLEGKGYSVKRGVSYSSRESARIALGVYYVRGYKVFKHVARLGNNKEKAIARLQKVLDRVSGRAEEVFAVEFKGRSYIILDNNIE